LQEPPGPSKEAAAVNWKSVAAFLQEGPTLEGAAVTKDGELVFIGSKREDNPTLEGHPVTLADLAVAYRAVFYAGHNNTYISLDRSPFPESVNVNFGGRLQDTRLGWVVLRCDLRFKTIGDGFDPATGNKVGDMTRQKISDFRTQQERRFSAPKKDRPQKESTRFWFYPDTVRIAVSTDGKQMRITSPRFKAAAEREVAVAASGEVAKEETPPWTEKAIAHFNDHYADFAKLFPEVGELDTAGRLLALFTWLRQYQTANNSPFDLDALLDVELPACSTPRRRTQMFFTYFVKGEGKSQEIYSYNLSSLLRQMADQRQRSDVTTGFRDKLLTNDLKQRAHDVGKDKLLADLAKAGANGDNANKDYHSSFVVTGGLDLDLREKLKTPEKLAEDDKKALDQLLDKPALKPLSGGKFPLVRTGGGSGAPPKLPPPPTLAAASAEGPRRPLGDWTISYTTNRALGYETVIAKDKEGRRLIQRVPARFSEDGLCVSIYVAENGDLERVVRRENGRTVSYQLDGKDDVFAVELSSPGAADSLLAAAAVKELGSSTRAWQFLPADSRILTIDRQIDEKVGVLSWEHNEYRLRIIADGKVVNELTGNEALAAMRAGTREKVAHLSTEKLTFSFVAPEGDDMVFQVGKKSVSVSLSAWERWVRNPDTKGLEELKDLFAGAGADGREVILVRDPLATRPKRLRDYPTEDAQDAVKLAVLLKSRFPDTRFAVDDPSPEVEARFAAMKDLRGPADLGLAIPPAEARVDDKKLLRLVGKQLTDAGIVPIEKPEDLTMVSNILVVNAHNNRELFDYVESLGKHQIDGHSALKGKFLLLNTCFEAGNSNMATELIERYGLSGVFLQSEVIDLQALQPVLLEAAQILKEAKTAGKSIRPGELLPRAAEKVLQSERWSDIPKDQVEKIKRGVLQISFLGPAKGFRVS
jgi:hypothetical protein